MLLQFINRKQELDFLESRYKTKKAEFIPIYGRRRTGKTELIKQFIHNKPHFYLLAKKQDLELELTRFATSIAQKLNIFIESSNNWEKLFLDIKNKVLSKKKFVIIIDEFPFWIEKDKSIVSEFQFIWDEILKESNCMLILCGSYVSMMETEVLGYKSPLYGRRTGQLKIDMLPFREFVKFFKSWDFKDVVKAYAVLDGIPFYIKEFELDKSLNKNIADTFWQPGAILNKEAEILLEEELREVGRYINIMKAIHDGATKLNQIATQSRVDITNINKYLDMLKKLQFIKTIYPVTDKTPKQKSFLHKVNDNYFNFWLSYVYPYQDDIAISELGALNDKLSSLDSYISKVFENICKEFLLLNQKSLHLYFNEIGTWWHKDKEIDLVAINEQTKEILFCECKWKDNINSEQILAELKEKSTHVQWHNNSRKEHFCIIAKSFKKKLSKDECLCYDLKDLEKVFRYSKNGNF